MHSAQPSLEQEQAITETIQLELDLYSDLHELLEEQQQLILGRDHQGLATTAQQITTLMLEARENRRARSEILKQLGLENTRSGMEQFMDSLRSNDRELIRADWQELIELVEDCQKINRINDQTLKLQHEAVEKILSQLPVQGTASKTYTSSGQEQISSRSILSAQA